MLLFSCVSITARINTAPLCPTCERDSSTYLGTYLESLMLPTYYMGET